MQEPLVIPLNRLVHRGQCLLTLLSRRTSVDVLVQLNARPIGQQAYRLSEIQVLHLAHERDLIPGDVTAEAVIDAFFRVHRERGGLLAVKRTQTTPAAAGLLEGHVLANERHDVGRGPNLCDLTVRYSHAQNVPPRSPRADAPLTINT